MSVAHRHILRVEPARITRSVPEAWRPAGASIVLGDNADARCLAAEIRRRGGVVHSLSLNQPAPELLQAFDRLSAGEPIPHLFLLGGRDPEARKPDSNGLHDRITRTYLLAQRWCQQLAQGDPRRPVSLVGLTSLGGDFGFVNPVEGPEGGALAGCLKSVFVEWRRQQRDGGWVKILDAPTSEPPEQLAKLVLDELTCDRDEVEVAFQGGERFVVRAHYEAANRQASSMTSSRDRPMVPTAIRAGGAWILTGGARGITSVVARHLGRQYGVHVHLVGRHPAPALDRALESWSEEQLRDHKRQLTRAALAQGKSPTRQWQDFCTELEISRTLRQLESDGITAYYHACDLSDSRAVARVVAEVRRISGPIEGIVHGAGVRIPSRFEQVTEEALQATLAAKATGLLHLLEATRQDPLAWFIGFGSVGGRFGTNGGTLYALGNEMVAKLTGWMRRERPECRSVCFHWHGWDEVGMMMGGASFGAQGVLKMRLMPPSEGIQHLENELRLGAPEAEVLLTDGELHRLHHPEDLVRGTPRGLGGSESDSAAPSLSSAEGSERKAGQAVVRKKTDAGSRSEDPALVEKRYPLLETPSVGDRNGVVAECCFDPVRDPFLVQHRFRDRPLLPFVMAIETLAEAAAQWGAPRQVVGLDDVRILSGFRFFEDHPQTARVKIQRSGDDLLAQLVADFHNRAGKLVQPDRVYAEARLRLADRPRAIDVSDPGPLPPLNQVRYPAEREDVLFHGPVFRKLKEIHCESWGGWARVIAPDLSEVAGHRGTSGWIHSPAVLDACLFACGIYPWLCFDKIVSLPHSLERLTFGPLPKAGEDCLLRFEYLGLEDGYCGFDFTLYGEDRRPLLQAQRFLMVVISGPVAAGEK